MTAKEYSGMARYYDAIYSSIVDYERELRRVEKIFRKHNSRKTRSILDVACGTGNYTFIFARKGFRTVGIDLSESMIEAAKSKIGSKKNPRFFKMDMRRITLREKFDAATVLFGGFGYLTYSEDVLKFFRQAKKILNPGGLLVLEFWQSTGVLPAAAGASGNTNWDRAEFEGKRILRLNRGKYDPTTNMLAINFDFYIVDLKANRLVDHFEELHTVKTYNVSDMKETLEDGGFKPLAFYEAGLGSGGELQPHSIGTFRVMAVATPNE